MPRKEDDNFGVCKLTGETGRFVKSHILPRALTKPSQPGAAIIGAQRGVRPSRYWDSWYDDRLVILRGENILAFLDDWAIRVLRSRHLVWSSWGGSELRVDDHIRSGDSAFGLRMVAGLDASRLRLFFLSLLWRAAASSRPEFDEVALPSEDVAELGRRIVDGDPGSLDFYPMSLVQLSTMGPPHNMAPIIRTTELPATAEHPELKLPHCRFYLEGLVAHFYLPPLAHQARQAMGGMILGAGEKLGVVTVPYEASYQDKALRQGMFEVERDWPDVLKRLL